MKLLMSPASPFVRKAMVFIRETKQVDDVALQNVSARPGETEPALAAANPVGKIPALVRDDGPTLYDSRVICRYLDARSEAGLYPPEDWDNLVLEATGDAMCEAAVAMVYEHRFRPEEKVHAPWQEAQWGKVESALDALTNRWMSHLEGPLRAGHIAVGCALGYLDFRHDARNWRKGHDALSDWYARFAERPSMQATAPHD